MLKRLKRNKKRSKKINSFILTTLDGTDLRDFVEPLKENERWMIVEEKNERDGNKMKLTKKNKCCKDCETCSGSSYWDVIKESKEIIPIIEFEKHSYIFKFNKEMFRRVYLDHFRYFVFYVDLSEIFFGNSGYNRVYVNKVISCRNRKDIGRLLNKERMKLMIVYYKTSSNFRFYVFSGRDTIRIRQEKIHNLSLWTLDSMIEEYCGYERVKCINCERSAIYQISYYTGEPGECIQLKKELYCETCAKKIDPEIIKEKIRIY